MFWRWGWRCGCQNLRLLHALTRPIYWTSLNTVTSHPSLKWAIMWCKPTNYSWDLQNFRPVLAALRRQCLGPFRFVHNLCNSPPPPTPHFMHCCTTVSTLYLHYYILLLLLPLALQPAVGFGLSNSTSPFLPILHQLSPSSHSQHLKTSTFYLILYTVLPRAGRLLAITKIYI